MSTRRSARRPGAVGLLTALVLALLASALLLVSGGGTRTVVADFDRTVGLFEGSDVRVMGMRIGEVSRITPRGTAVRVEITYDSQYRLPADVKAVVVAPSVIADRFVQLTPGYVDGPVLASGAVIDQQDTRIPVELDDSLRTTTDLMTALGPDGANTNGALSAALTAVAEVLEGNGAPTREALRDLAAATEVIGGGAEEFSSTVKSLSKVSGTLAAYDDDIRRFNSQLGAVTGSLADDAGELSTLLETLAGTLGEVASFVADNRAALVTDVDRLAAVTTALVNQRAALTEILDIAPLAFTNLTETYDAQAQAVRTRANFGEIIRVVDRVICDALRKQAGAAIEPLCAALREAFDQLPVRDGIPAPNYPAAPAPGAPAVPTEQRASRPGVGALTLLAGSMLGGSR